MESISDGKTNQRNSLFQALIALLYRPNQILSRIISNDIANWTFPMFILSLSVITQSLVQISTLQQQNNIQDVSSAVIIILIFNIAHIWIAWFWLSGVFRSFFILAGLRTEFNPRFLISWSMTPFVLRNIVRIIYSLITQIPITSPGLSGLIQQSEGFIHIFISQVLSQVDIYLVWHIILIIIGLKHIRSISQSQRILALIISVFSLFVLWGLLGTISVYLKIL